MFCPWVPQGRCTAAGHFLWVYWHSTFWLITLLTLTSTRCKFWNPHSRVDAVRVFATSSAVAFCCSFFPVLSLKRGAHSWHEWCSRLSAVRISTETRTALQRHALSTKPSNVEIAYLTALFNGRTRFQQFFYGRLLLRSNVEIVYLTALLNGRTRLLHTLLHFWNILSPQDWFLPLLLACLNMEFKFPSSCSICSC